MSNYMQDCIEARNVLAYLKRHGKEVDSVRMLQYGFGHSGTKKGLPVRATTITNNVEVVICVPSDARRSEDDIKWWVDPRKTTDWQDTMLEKLREHYIPATIEIISGDRLVIDGEVIRDVMFYSTVNCHDIDYWLKKLISQIDKFREKIKR